MSNDNNIPNFDFSVIIPVYNVEQYLEESILSVINQTYSFKEHIQMILVNDGSPDNSEEICVKYQKLYPDNIIYVKQENGGVSSARNNGMNYAQGKYINFLDSDDMWEPDAFEKIHDFISENPGIEVLCCKVQHFEGANHLHPLSRRLRDTRIVDIHLEENYTYPHLQVSSSFLREDYAKSIRFDSDLIIGEDALYLNLLILRAGRYASMPEVQYNYRTRMSQSSAIQNKENNVKFYQETIQGYYRGIIDASIEICGSVIPYIQSLLAYDIGWRMSRGKPDVLTQEQYDDYLDKLSEILSYVDDNFILAHPIHRSIFKKQTMLRIKYKKDAIFSKFSYNPENRTLYCGETVMANILKNPSHCEIFRIEHVGSDIIVYGLIKSWIIDADCTTDFVLTFAGKEYKPELTVFPHRYEDTMFGRKYALYQFCAKIPFDEAFKDKNTRWIQPRLYFGEEKTIIAMRCGRKILTTETCPAPYNIMDRYYFIPTEKGIRFVKPADIKKAEKKIGCSFHQMGQGK